MLPRNGPVRIKWWNMKESENLVEDIVLLPITTIEETWTNVKEQIHRSAKKYCGVTEEVKEAVREKKKKYHAFLQVKTLENWNVYKDARKRAKCVVAATNSRKQKALNRQKQIEDIGCFHYINDGTGKLTNDKEKVCEIWRKHYEMIGTTEFPHPPIPYINRVLGPME
ncbi:hypothetical protein GJ496_002502 [Pomphorhynchus laevis]|nr:hypothetical protein GJ496_002502 [Pomphorhynchus laevis]